MRGQAHTGPGDEPEVLSVSDVNARAASILQTAPGLQRILVEGEVSKWFPARSGHVYFTLKDDRAAVDCVMWRSAAARLPEGIREGMSVLVRASARMYEVQGRYQLQAESVRPAGEGVLWIRFQELKRKLDAEGLFDPGRKRPVPRIPGRIGVVSSRDGAAFQDIRNVLGRRAPYVEVVLADARVQGATAAPTLVAALRRLQQEPVDVIIVARGGGSLEDLWAFNEEPVVRAMAACPVPIISGVGHETDTTLADFVADLRAPTPSSAAEKAALALDELHQSFDHLEHRMASRLGDRLARARQRFDSLTSRPVLRQPDAVFAPLKQRLEGLASRQVLRRPEALLAPLHQRLRAVATRRVMRDPEGVFAPVRQRLDDAARRLPRAADARIGRAEDALRRTAATLDALSPLKVLGRGYAVATRDGHAIVDAMSVAAGDQVQVRVAKGRLRTRVVDVVPEPEPKQEDRV